MLFRSSASMFSFETSDFGTPPLYFNARHVGNAYLADVDKQAEKRFERLVEQMKQSQGITEQLKSENALEWAGRMNNIRACAREIVEKEIIYA